MVQFLADHGGLISPIAAIVNGFIALVVAQFFKEHTGAKIFLVTSAALLSVAAIAATIASDRHTIAVQSAADARRAEVREKIGKFITEGSQIISNCHDNSRPPEWGELNDWIARVQSYLGGELGPSYSARLVSPAGAPLNISCNGADADHDRLFRVGNIVNFRLEQFSAEAASWPSARFTSEKSPTAEPSSGGQR